MRRSLSANREPRTANRIKDDAYWMSLAAAEARKAEKEGEVPVGAVAVLNGKKIASAHNRPIKSNDPTAHAEILTLRKAAKRVRNYRLSGIILYVTKEPCPMCKGALVWARVKKVVYGCPDIKGLNHRCIVKGGVLRKETAQILRNFFKKKR